jgi:choline-sulfatase
MKPLRVLAAVLALVALGLAVWFLRAKPQPPPPAPAAPAPGVDLSSRADQLNILLISMDALRYDRTGFSGHPGGLTPHLDALMSESVIFHDTTAPASWTLPSHLAVWTGLWPSRHGVTNKLGPGKGEEMIRRALASEIPTYPDLLIQAGWVAAAFTGGAGVQAAFGYGRGFDRYQDDRYFGGFDYGIDPALEWIAAHRDRRFFLFLHGYDVHGQFPLPADEIQEIRGGYTGPLDGGIEEQGRLREQGLATIQGPGGKPDLSGVLTSEDAAFLARVYDRKVRDADARVGRFLERFRAMGLMDDTIVAVISDHGDEFLEHRGLDHGHTLYEEQLRVVMALRFPGYAQRMDVREPVRLLDLFPTVFDALGLQGPPGVDGRSLLPLLRQERVDLPIFAETDYRLFVHHRSARRGTRKLILDLADGGTELYDLAADPGETHDLATEDPRSAYELEQLVRAWLAQTRTDPAAYLGVHQDPITLF